MPNNVFSKITMKPLKKLEDLHLKTVFIEISGLEGCSFQSLQNLHYQYRQMRNIEWETKSEYLLINYIH